MRCAALTIQQKLRDLANLSSLVDEVEWIAVEQAAEVNRPLVICALWLWEAAAEAATILQTRSLAGKTTLVVPRFRAGDLMDALKAPSAIGVTGAEFHSLEWDGQHFDVPGASVFQTSLHAGKWATSTGVGAVIMAYRPHTAAGPIVLCSAAVTGHPLGVDLDAQRALFTKILETAAAQSAVPDAVNAPAPRSDQATTIDAFISEEGEVGAAFLLARLATGEQEELGKVARQCLSIELAKDEIGRLTKRLPQVTAPEITTALRQHGWGAYLRRIANIQSFDENK
ncbi:MAG: hypothetical protein MOB07_16215 [Acidobacteria bacterium]|nr:hypothetical protein [Acidobacteriota bacterium]